MTNERKRIEKFCNIKAEAEFREVAKVLEILCFRMKNVKGSHYTFERRKNGRVENLTIPVHCGKVKKRYVRMIQELIKMEYEKI